MLPGLADRVIPLEVGQDRVPGGHGALELVFIILERPENVGCLKFVGSEGKYLHKV